MTMKSLFSAAAAGGLAMQAAPAAAADHVGKQISTISFNTSTQCLYLKLQGVSQADPLAPGNPYMVIPRSHPDFAQMFAMLLSARAINAPINIVTDGVPACGGMTGISALGIDR